MNLLILVVFLCAYINLSECVKHAWLPSMLENFHNQSLISLRQWQHEEFMEHHHKRKNRTHRDYSNKLLRRSKIDTTTTSTTPPTEPTTVKRPQRVFLGRKGVFNMLNITDISTGSFREPKYNAIHQPQPSDLLTTPQLIAAHGYPAESHTIVTEDGYILTVHRIPHSRKFKQKKPSRKTTLLHHGLLGSSADWVISGPEKGLAYILSDAGYDVWLANVRGNTYSRAHVSRNVHSPEFWNFTFHEVSQHDLPAVIDYIMELKGMATKINYIGHSMGTTVLFALLSTKPIYNKILRAGFALAPVAYMSDIKSPIRLLAKFSHNIEYLMHILGEDEFLPQSKVLRWLSQHACEINNYEEVFCENSMFVLCGNDDGQFNRTLLPLILSHLPAGASTKTLIHYAQEIKNKGKFQQFDYGHEGNFKAYGTYMPPEYPVHKITLPIALFSGANDWLSSYVDAENLYLQLVNPIQHYTVPLKAFNHIDFLWAIDAPKLVYEKLLSLLLDTNIRPTVMNFEGPKIYKKRDKHMKKYGLAAYEVTTPAVTSTNSEEVIDFRPSNLRRNAVWLDIDATKQIFFANIPKD